MDLSIGSGFKPIKDFINIDKNKNAPGVDLVYDLDNYPWPFRNQSIKEVFESICLERLVNRNRAILP